MAQFRAWINLCEDLDAYHGTDRNFDNFVSPNTEFIHFGSSPKQANSRLRFKASEDDPEFDKNGNIRITNKYGEGARIIPVKLKVQNPLRMPDIGDWSVFSILHKLRKSKNKELANGAKELLAFNTSVHDNFEAEFRKYVEDNNINLNKPTNARMQFAERYYTKQDDLLKKMFVDMLRSLGYDGIVYKNRYEGRGDSYLVFDNSQIAPRFKKAS